MVAIKHTFYEFFAGGGMARAGLGPNWVPLFANDFDRKKAETYRLNWGGSELVVADVAEVKPHQLPGHADLAWASFPCQDLSLAGAGKGLDGARSGTFWPFWRLMEALNAEGRGPRIIALENVYGAVRSHGGRDFSAIANAFSDLGYRVGALLIDGVHFVPQSRMRLFIVGVKRNMDVPDELIRSKPHPLWHPKPLREAAQDLPEHTRGDWVWWELPIPKEPPATLEDLIEPEPTGVTWHSPEETDYLLSLMSSINLQKVDEARASNARTVGTVYRRTRKDAQGSRIQRAEVRFDGIAGCLRTPAGGSSRQTILMVEGKAVRSRLLSPREAARLMGLPDSYVLPTNYNSAYHLVGDGVVVPVVHHLARNLFDPLLASSKEATMVERATLMAS